MKNTKTKFLNRSESKILAHKKQNSFLTLQNPRFLQKIIFLLIALILLVGCNKNPTVTINNQIVHVELAQDNIEITQGLMYREHLDENTGMLFLFPNEQKRTFWMKNTFIPLDIIFISAEKEIVKIQNAVPCKEDPCDIYPSNKPAKYVLEVNANFSEEHKIIEGMTVNINI